MWRYSFNSRTLGRVRLTPRYSVIALAWFQFTHPGKGATSTTRKTQELFNCVSIHAPWEGCDSLAGEWELQTHTFQFTHPGKGATKLNRAVSDPFGVSIHAPWEGCDFYLLSYTLPQTWFQFTHPGKGATLLNTFLGAKQPYVSIHAPWEGCD